MAAKRTNNPIQILDDDCEADLSFLAELDAAEAEPLSLSSAKRRRVTLPETVLEGSYTAALKGSRSMTWNQIQSSSSAAAAIVTGDSTPGSILGGGACFKCGVEGHWARNCGVSSSVSVAREGESEKACACGMGSCLVLTANTERNRGRKFYKCPLRQDNGGCGFFEWCDESSGGHTSAQERAWKNGCQQDIYQQPANKVTTGFARSWDAYDKGTGASNSGYGAVKKFETTENKGYTARTGSSCFKCGEEGHWARDCPTPASSMAANATGTTSSNSCFKCGKSGHWAKDCSQGQVGQPVNVRYK